MGLTFTHGLYCSCLRFLLHVHLLRNARNSRQVATVFQCNTTRRVSPPSLCVEVSSRLAPVTLKTAASHGRPVSFALAAVPSAPHCRSATIKV